MANDKPDLTGISDKKAEVVTALANFGTTAITEVGNLGRYIGRILGTTPEDVVGLTIGDPLRFLRVAAAAWYDQRLGEICQRRGVTDPLPVSPSLAIPLVRAAYDETRPELRELWAQLIASAMDPARADQVRISFIETLRRFDPLDALVLKRHYDQPGIMHPNTAAFTANMLGRAIDDVLISADNLVVLNCITPINTDSNFTVTRYGRALVRACSD